MEKENRLYLEWKGVVLALNRGKVLSPILGRRSPLYRVGCLPLLGETPYPKQNYSTYIPAGSTNDFASSIGIPKDMEKAAEAAVTGKPFPCDVGLFNGDYFVYVAAFGLFTEVSYKTSQEWKNVLGHAAYILEGAKCLHDIPSFMMQVEYNNMRIQDEFIYGMITNSTSVGGFKGMTGKDVLLDDGVFEVTLIKKPKNPMELNEIIASLINLVDDTDMIYSFKTAEVKFTASREIPWTLDGEFGGDHEEVCVKNLKQAVDIIVKKPEESKI